MDIQKQLQMFYILKFAIFHKFEPVVRKKNCAYYWVASPDGNARVFVDVCDDGNIIYTPEIARPNSESLMQEIKDFVERGKEPERVRTIT